MPQGWHDGRDPIETMDGTGMGQATQVREAPGSQRLDFISEKDPAVADPQPIRVEVICAPVLPRTPEPTVRPTPSFLVAPRPSPLREGLIRLFDVVGSLSLLILAGPVLLIVASVIKITSRGPILYKQRRVGKDGRHFTLYKFRTMIHDAERGTGPVLATPDDPRVTRFGRLLRRTRIDEFPQLYNVLRADMSLVGPRPERPFFVDRHRALQGVRLSVRPGLTGLAQIRSLYNLKPTHKVKYDYLYIQNRSLWLNAYVLVRTIPVLLMKKGW